MPEEIILEVREYCEGMDVSIVEDESSGQMCIRAYNEGGFNQVHIDLEDLWAALCKLKALPAP